ncbi:MAG: hypothetical protein U0Y96_12935 [Candidatus Kapaibacterium sp.]
MISLLHLSCTPENSITNPQSTATVKTVVTGRIMDEQGNAIEGVLIKIGNTRVKTNVYGVFITTMIDVPAERLFLIAEKGGYFKGYRAETPIVNGVTQIVLRLQSNASQGSFNATVGKTISLLNRATVVLPANGYILANGTAYTGDVYYAVKYLDPEAQNFYDYFAGDFTAKSMSGDIVDLLSFGVLKVELTADNGQPVNLAIGSTATLKVPIPNSLNSNAPATIPLWSFDEVLGMWKEEFVATKSGDYYEGKVSHFTDWNFDAKGETATLRLKVACNGKTITSVKVTVGQKKFLTGNDFTKVRRVPANIPLKLKVFANENNGLETSEVTITLRKDETKDVELITVNCPGLVIGNVVTCNTTPTDATLIAEYNDGTYGYGYAHNGLFSMFIKPNQNVRLKAFAADGTVSDYAYIPQLMSQESYNAGYLYCCNGNVIQWNDFLVSKDTNVWKLPSGISSDGLIYYTFDNGVLKEWNTLKGTLVNETVVGVTWPLFSYPENYNTLEVSSDNRIGLFQLNDTTFVTYDLITHTTLQKFISYAENAYLSPSGEKVLFSNTWSISVQNSYTGSTLQTIKSINGHSVEKHSFVTDFLDNDNFGVVLNRSVDSLDKTFYSINATTGNITSQYTADILGYYTSSSDAGLMVVSPQSPLSRNVTLTVFNFKTGTILSNVVNMRRKFGEKPLAVCTQDGKYVVAYTNNGNEEYYLGVFSTTTGQPQWRYPIPESTLWALSISRDGKTLAGLYDDTKGGVWCRIWKL